MNEERLDYIIDNVTSLLTTLLVNKHASKVEALDVKAYRVGPALIRIDIKVNPEDNGS